MKLNYKRTLFVGFAFLSICNQIRTNCCAGCLHARPHSSLIPVVAGLVVGARMCLARVCAAQPEIAGLYAGTLIIAEIL